MTDTVRRLHVAMRTELDAPGGLNAAVRGIAAAQERAGLDVTIAAGSNLESPLDPKVFDLVHYHFAPTAQTFLHQAKWRSVPRVFHFHGPWAEEGKVHGDGRFKVTGKALIERYIYRRFGQFIAASDAFGELLQRRYRVPAKSVAVVDLGVDTDVYRPGSKEAARQALELPEGPLIASVRRLEPRMGLDVLVRAAERVPNVSVAIAGAGPEAHVLSELAASIGVKDRVRLLGRITEQSKILLYQAADLTVVPTRSLEGFGLVVLESMACGTPVVSSSQGGLVQAMGPFADDWTFRVGDVDALAALVPRAIGQPRLRQQVREYALTRTWDDTARRVEAVVAPIGRTA